mmetsp:Transcript_21398/g.35678  ORF Transcript_21398/g.35678 Transcript_21398/m.35678 type:complete len:90 (-) Transcript_21398:1900-2169(-)
MRRARFVTHLLQAGVNAFLEICPKSGGAEVGLSPPRRPMTSAIRLAWPSLGILVIAVEPLLEAAGVVLGVEESEDASLPSPKLSLLLLR